MPLPYIAIPDIATNIAELLNYEDFWEDEYTDIEGMNIWNSKDILRISSSFSITKKESNQNTENIDIHKKLSIHSE